MPLYRRTARAASGAHRLEQRCGGIFDWEVERLSIRMGERNDKITSLSGGNQQKVLIGRAFALNPDDPGSQRSGARRRRRRQERALPASARLRGARQVGRLPVERDRGVRGLRHARDRVPQRQPVRRVRRRGDRAGPASSRRCSARPRRGDGRARGGLPSTTAAAAGAPARDRRGLPDSACTELPPGTSGGGPTR